jgi:sugar lactone lactonase YvrE
MHTVAGTPRMPGFSGDGGDPLQAQFSFPTGSNPQPSGTIAVDSDGLLPEQASLYRPVGVSFSPEGDMYIIDTNNNRIRRVRQ